MSKRPTLTVFRLFAGVEHSQGSFISTTMKNSVTEILKERQSTHGEFRDNSRVSRRLRTTINEELKNAGKPAFTNYQEEALVMICHKLARIIVGNDKFADHWKDIAGYAQLTADRLEEDYHDQQ